MRSLGWPQIQSGGCPSKKRRSGHRQAQRDDHSEHREEKAVCEPQREASGKAELMAPYLGCPASWTMSKYPSAV